MTFDLKGSTYQRKIKFNQPWWRKYQNCKKCMKDNNFIEINRDLNNTLVNFTNDQIKKFSTMIEMDSKFLRDHNLMDYSLLMTIEFLEHRDK